jgi:hypothetical protein
MVWDPVPISSETLSAQALSPPANDQIEGATPVTGLPFGATEAFDAATLDPHDPQPSCSPPPEATAWFTATPASTIAVTAALAPAFPSAQLAVFTGPAHATASSALSEVGCFGDVPATLHLQAGTTYYFMVFDNVVVGSFTLDFAAAPTVLPGNSSVVEGNSGTTALQIPVTLSSASSLPVSVAWTTLACTGCPGHPADPATDYVPGSGTVTFAPGETSKVVTVEVNGDTSIEPDEYVAVAFSQPTNAVVGGFYGLGFGLIVNDD